MKKELLVTREDLMGVIKRWQRGEMDSRQVQDWARERFVGYGWEREDEITGAVLDILDGLEANLMTTEEAPVFEKALEKSLPIKKALDMLDKHINGIDNSARRKKLKNDPFYGPYIEDTESLAKRQASIPSQTSKKVKRKPRKK